MFLEIGNKVSIKKHLPNEGQKGTIENIYPEGTIQAEVIYKVKFNINRSGLYKEDELYKED
jgi:hypothetical protein